jgi:hypothetical protein
VSLEASAHRLRPHLPPLDHPWTMAVLASATGAGMGLARADWQWAVEVAQTASGVVSHPPDSVPAIVAASLWSLVTQACGVGLRLGLSEATLSLVVSAAGTALAMLALAMLAYASSQRTLVSLGAALAVVGFRLAEPGFGSGGVIYPIYLLPTPHTYGAIGLFSALVAVGAVGSGWSRAGAFLLGLLPAIHASIGATVVAAAGITLLWQRRTESGGPGLRWAGSGLALSAISLLVHKLMFADTPPAPSNADAYLDAFVGFWDGHRQQVNWDSTAVRNNAVIPILAVLALSRGGSRFTSSFRWLLRLLAVMGVLSLGVAAVTHVPPGKLPSWLVIAMPGRVLNVNVLAFAALSIGLAAAWLWPAATDAADIMRRTRLTRAAAPTLAVVFLLVGTTAYHAMRRNPMPLADQFALPPNDPAFQAASRGEGRLLTSGGLWLIQLRTRRPVLIDGGTLDTLPYALASAPQVDRILREIYGTNLFDPPPEARNTGTVPADWTRQTWESYSFDAWRRIGRDWSVTQVLAYGDWQLDLPRVARSRDFALYQIPR